MLACRQAGQAFEAASRAADQEAGKRAADARQLRIQAELGDLMNALSDVERLADRTHLDATSSHQVGNSPPNLLVLVDARVLPINVRYR